MGAQKLALYGSVKPLILPLKDPIQNVEELYQKQCQAQLGYYLSLFEPSNKNPPFSLPEVKKMVKRFLAMLEKEGELNQTDFQGGESTQNIHINELNCKKLEFNNSNIQSNKQDIAKSSKSNLFDFLSCFSCLLTLFRKLYNFFVNSITSYFG
ncbi:MAG: hypothetical protein QNJ27_02375 [Simkaniaceae bacterium]|nr:hypothetical protein [Simkaniaceae bacterium]